MNNRNPPTVARMTARIPIAALPCHYTCGWLLLTGQNRLLLVTNRIIPLRVRWKRQRVSESFTLAGRTTSNPVGKLVCHVTLRSIIIFRDGK